MKDELADKCKAIEKLEDELIEFRNLLLWYRLGRSKSDPIGKREANYRD